MRILHVEDFFHPDAGYQINILPKYLTLFGHENVIVTSQMENVPQNLTSFFGVDDIEEKDAKYEEANNVRIIRVHVKKFVSGRAVFNTKELMAVIEEFHPDILYAHGNDSLSGMQLLVRSKKLDYVIVTDSHMLEMASKNSLRKAFRLFYRAFITPRIIKQQIPVIRTQNDDYVERCLGIPLTQAPWISYGSDLLLFHKNSDVKEEFRKKYQIPQNAKIFVYTGKVDQAKGGMLLAEAFRETLDENVPAVLVIVGSLSGDYGKKVDEILKSSKNKVIMFPTQKYNDLPFFYQIADFSVFARQCSLSFYDAQACGLPVISEDNNINIDRNSHDNGICFVKENIDSFRNCLIKMLKMNSDEYASYSNNSINYIKQNYNYENKAREYEKVLLDAYYCQKKK